jgi:hypothetical protein
MDYEGLPLITREEYRRTFQTGSPAEARVALLRVVLHDADHDWAEGECCAALRDPRKDVRLAGAMGLAHLARLSRRLGPRALSLLHELRNTPELGGYVEDALDDLMVFGPSDEQ